MPSNRTKRVRVPILVFNRPVALHLSLGTCLLAGEGDGCGCGLRDARGSFIAEAAQHLWSRNRGAVLKTWGHPFACFSQVLFDAAKLPSVVSPTWPERAQRDYAILVEELEAAGARVTA